MNRYQPIYDIAEICAQKDIKQAVLCPGSRCAPLVIAFSRHPQLEVKTFSDERSAGFIALGMTQQSHKPTVLLCTSGSAAFNFAPAVAEAFFSQIPLIVFTADRPAEWIAQHDGQTIYQTDIFGRHVKKSYQLPQEYDHADAQWAINRIVNEALNISQQEPKGPVHINAPFREPLYPGKDETITFRESVRIIHDSRPEVVLSDYQKKRIQDQWKSFHNVLIVAGQHDYQHDILGALQHLIHEHPIAVVGDVISNLHPLEDVVRHADVFLGQASDDVKKSLRPDLLITYGKSVISKNVKIFLRQYAPRIHWHLQASGAVSDPFQSISEIFQVSPFTFFSQLSLFGNDETFERQKQANYKKLWEVEERRATRTLREFFPQPELSELELVGQVLENLPVNATLHLANSMSVRYANFIGLKAAQKGIRVMANRGTSGIDGCTSTAVGQSLNSDSPQFLITGDVAFFYDRNAFWHNYPLPNLRIVLLNNHGGVIFKMIDGPGSLPETEDFFVTKQNLHAKHLCDEFGYDHLRLDSKRKLKNLLKDFMEFDGRTKILEFESGTDLNKNIVDHLKQKIKQSYEL
ncbi:MAG: 2-succinyl-5-enolpyruvyl-6-hydroxy-3-cyclohexene-1-carboxylic-acid synthase [Cyclobacteriaceae bacterium]|nr:2-succinyl-5-enolpyruvyl-6-hydroxy-3-cyclohexene-1-carboxylic-acid synthase [Cyclobacteriaceae bacterium]